MSPVHDVLSRRAARSVRPTVPTTLRPAVLSTCFLLLAAPATAQETTGGVRGRIVSAVTGPLAGASVTATGPHLLGQRHTRSAGDGVFYLPALPPGRYTIQIAAIGHRPLEVADVLVQLGAIAGVGELTLETAAIELDPVRVTAAATTLDPVRTTVGARLTDEDLTQVPAGRDYKSVITILPHVNESHLGDPPNVAGSTGIENMYFVDGVNVTSELNAMTSITLPYNFVRALEVKAGGYEAQYGKALGAVVNAVTHTGTNDFETAVFGFFAGGGLRASPKELPSLRETGAANYDIGGRVSGPIARDRLWFSAAYNARIDRVDREITGLGVYPDRRTAHLFAGKLSWHPSRDMNVALSIFGDPTTHHRVSPYGGTMTLLDADRLLRFRESGGVAGTVRATASPTGWLLVEGSLSYSRTKASSLPDVDTTQSQPAYTDFVAQTISGFGGFSDVSQGRATFMLHGTANVGRHTVIVGVEYEDARVTAQDGTYAVYRPDSSQWQVVDELSARGTFHNRVPTTYVQDAWRMTDRLTVNAGVRWSAQILSGASGSTAQKFPNEWQPRVGVSWQLDRGGMHRLFGSYGRFYQQIPLNLSRFWYVDYYGVYSTYSEDPRLGNVLPDEVVEGSTLEEEAIATWGRIDGIDVENFDEFTAGYEGLFVGQRFAVRGILRDLRSSFQWGVDPESDLFWVVGTPGKGAFDYLPPPKRTYAALELSLTGEWQRLQYRASYVLSRNWGNYTGLYDSDFRSGNPGGNGSFSVPEQAVNTEGFLPNDRRHVLKLTTTYRTAFGFTPSAFVSWMSGTPLNEWGWTTWGYPTFLVPRGSVGRTPAIWDLNVRLAYTVPWRGIGTARFVLDLLHLGNPQQSVLIEQLHYFAQDADGNPSNPNPDYLEPFGYQPPMAARLGVELGF